MANGAFGADLSPCLREVAFVHFRAHMAYEFHADFL